MRVVTKMHRDNQARKIERYLSSKKHWNILKDQYLPHTCLLIWCLLRIEGHLEDRIYIYICVCVKSVKICHNDCFPHFLSFLHIRHHRSCSLPKLVAQGPSTSNFTGGALPSASNFFAWQGSWVEEQRGCTKLGNWLVGFLVFSVRLPNYGPLFGNEASTTGGMALTFAWESIPIDDSLARPLGHSRMLECCELWVTIYNLHRFAILISSYILKGATLAHVPWLPTEKKYYKYWGGHGLDLDRLPGNRRELRETLASRCSLRVRRSLQCIIFTHLSS
jgi:hypothetical protein